MLVGVYIPPQANAKNALCELADQITTLERKFPDSFTIILGDFNRANLNHELPKYRQHIDCPTRDNIILDHCYTTVKDAYRSVPRAALGHSDHCMVHLIPVYRQKLKRAKPVVKTVKKWTNAAKQELQDCFDCTDWTVFEAASDNLDELTDTVTSYISFCEDVCVPTKTFCTYNNNKAWIYSQKLEERLSANDPASVWRGLQEITSYRRPPPTVEANKDLANELNTFYCRFETDRFPHLTLPSPETPLQTLTPNTPSTSPPFTLTLSNPKPTITGLNDYRPIALTQRSLQRKASGLLSSNLKKSRRFSLQTPLTTMTWMTENLHRHYLVTF
ncbi:protocadherin gamma subfamily B [Sarotherodon galilaeus]